MKKIKRADELVVGDILVGNDQGTVWTNEYHYTVLEVHEYSDAYLRVYTRN